MLKNVKLIYKISFLAAVILLISMAIQGMLLLNIRELNLDNAATKANAISTNFSTRLTQSVTQTESNVKQLSQDLSDLIPSRHLSRSDAIQLLSDRLGENEHVVAFGLGLEPNAFDGNDALFANQKQLCSDSNGRFLPYVSKNDQNQVSLDLLTGYDESGSGDWYLVPKKSGQSIVTEPYSYTVNGKEIMMFTIAYPIMDSQHRFLGVLTADISIDQLQSSFEKEPSLNEAKAVAMLFTEKGQILSSTIDKSLVNQTKLDLPIIQRIIQEKPSSIFVDTSIKGNERYMASAKNVTFINQNKWHLLVAIPDSVILRTYRLNQYKSFAMIGFSILLAMGLMFFIVNSINRPIKRLIRVMKAVENGDLTESASLDSTDEIGQLSTSFDNMIDSLRSLIHEVQDTSGIVENSSDHLSSVAQQNARTISEINTIVGQIAEANVRQAEDIEGIVTKTSILGDMLNESGQVIDLLSQVSDKTNVISNQGVKTLGELDEKSAQTRELSVEITKTVSDVNDAVSNIENIAILIDGIAAKTNLLALNASIEAARAGDAGRGFAVVADEIRSLAEQTTLATKDIKMLISQVLEKSSAAVLSVEEVTSAQNSEFQVIHETIDIFNEIIDSFKTISEQIQKIESNSNVIDASKNGILDAMTNISALTEETTASTEEVTSTMNEQKESMDRLSDQSGKLSQLTESLKQKTSRFKI